MISSPRTLVFGGLVGGYHENFVQVFEKCHEVGDVEELGVRRAGLRKHAAPALLRMRSSPLAGRR
jgi:hypothetical protein